MVYQNRFPVWKNALIALVVCVATLYALPNWYGDAPALQIAVPQADTWPKEATDRIVKALEGAGIVASAVQPVAGSATASVRFATEDDQIHAQSVLQSALPSDWSVALHLESLTPKWLQAIGGRPVKLGLDLRGGVHFLLEVDLQNLVERRLSSSLSHWKKELREQKIRYASMHYDPSTQAAILVFPNAQMRSEALSYLRARYSDMAFHADTENPAGQHLAQSSGQYSVRARFQESGLDAIRNYAMDQTLSTLRKRVDELAVAEALVQRQGAERIVVELPGIQDTARAKALIGKTATVQFHLVDATDPMQGGEGRLGFDTKRVSDRRGQSRIVKTHPVLTGENIIGAQSSYDQYGRPVVGIHLGGDATAIQAFTRATERHIGHPMATVYIETRYQHGEKRTLEHIINVATIQDVLGDRFQISGLAGAQEARDLALLLRSGALAAPVHIVEERTIGPSLGQENIRMGMQSIALGLLLVVLFMGLYYSILGWIANLALCVNLVLLLALLSLLGATLTLPGMAGILLTLGMAVDANVLVFERIREELRQKVSVQAAIFKGFERAFLTILDANVTSLIVALVLYAIGTGPIKGFAVILILGLATSLFTAITVTRALINTLYGNRSLSSLPIGIRVA